MKKKFLLKVNILRKQLVCIGAEGAWSQACLEMFKVSGGEGLAVFTWLWFLDLMQNRCSWGEVSTPTTFSSAPEKNKTLSADIWVCL